MSQKPHLRITNELALAVGRGDLSFHEIRVLLVLATHGQPRRGDPHEIADVRVSLDRLQALTGMPRSTVKKARRGLRAKGYLIDTGARCGRTFQIPVERLCLDDAKGGTAVTPFNDRRADPSPVDNSASPPRKGSRAVHERGHGRGP